MYDTKTTSGYSRARIEKLSVPKESKQEWATGFDSWQLRWGDKDSMWQITDAAKQARPKKRTLKLAVPKKDFQNHNQEVHLYTFSCGRSSPIRKIEKLEHTRVQATNRIQQLAQPKTLPGISGKLWTYSCGRESPIWRTKKPSINRPSENDERLALPKISHKEFQPNRELKANGRLNPNFVRKLLNRGDSVCTDRLAVLADPKPNKRDEGKFADRRHPEMAIRHPNVATLKATPSERISELAKPNDKRYEKYIHDRFEWPVSKKAMKAMVTDRTTKLASPVVRPSMEHTQYDPDAFFVKAAAKQAKCSQRLQDLSAPIQR